MSTVSIRGVLKNGATPSGSSRPLIPTAQTLTWARGEDGTISILVVDSAGAVVNLTGKSLYLGLRKLDASDPVLVRNAVLTDPTNGRVTFYLTAADTADLSESEPPRYDVWLQDSDGRHQVVPSSFFVVLEAETLTGDSPSSAGIYSPFTNGVVDTVNTTGVKLSAVDCTGLTDGFTLWVREKNNYYHIEIGNGYTVDHDVYEIALNLTGGQWKRTPAGPQGAPATPELAAGSNITDTNGQSLTPGSSEVSQYTLSATLTANRSVGVQVSGLVTNQLIEFIRRANTGAFTLTLVNLGPAGGSFVFQPHSTKGQAITLFFNSVDLLHVGFRRLSS
jgi:hypothetical protein